MCRLAFVFLVAIAMFTPASATQINPTICAIGYDKRGVSLEVPKSTDTVLMFVILDKPCDGPVIVRFAVTTATKRNSVVTVTVTLRARCMETGGYTNPCAVGRLLYPLGNVAYLTANAGARRETHSYEFVIEHQKAGKWKYDLMLAADPGDGIGHIGSRTMVVEAHPEP